MMKFDNLTAAVFVLLTALSGTALAEGIQHPEDTQDPPESRVEPGGSTMSSQPPPPANVQLAAMGDFLLLDNISDAVYHANLANVTGDILLNNLDLAFWADLSPSDQIGLVFAANADASTIVRIGEVDGQIESEIPTDQEIKSIAFDVDSRILWGINRPVADNRLFMIDSSTGSTTLVGDTGIVDDITALVYDPVTDQLYAAERPDRVHAIDPETAQATFLGNAGLDFLFGLAWNPADGGIYGTDAGTDSIYGISRSDGSATFVGGPYSLATFATGLSFAGVTSQSIFADGFETGDTSRWSN